MKYSEKALENFPLFFQELNDIDIFVEDEKASYLKIYKEVFNKVFNSKYKVVKIFPLGCKRSVVEKFNETDTNKDEINRKKLFIIDSDFDYFDTESHQLKTVSNKTLFSLPAYCIENILFNDRIICDALSQSSPTLSSSDIYKLLFEKMNFEKDIDNFFNLFCHFYSSEKLALGLKTVSTKAYSYFSETNKIDVCDTKIKSKIDEINKKITESDFTNSEHFKKTQDLIKKKYDIKIKINYISAKDFIFPLIFYRIKIFDPDNEFSALTIRNYLIQNQDFNNLKDIFKEF